MQPNEQERVVKHEYIRSRNHLADILTKALVAALFSFQVAQLSTIECVCGDDVLMMVSWVRSPHWPSLYHEFPKVMRLFSSSAVRIRWS